MKLLFSSARAFKMMQRNLCQVSTMFLQKWCTLKNLALRNLLSPLKNSGSEVQAKYKQSTNTGMQVLLRSDCLPTTKLRLRTQSLNESTLDEKDFELISSQLKLVILLHMVTIQGSYLRPFSTTPLIWQLNGQRHTGGSLHCNCQFIM